jgi:hypothetical protein
VLQLKESRSELISTFHQKWRKRGPEILRALFDAVNSVKIDFESLPRVPDRRAGFGLVQHVVQSAFGLTPDYTIQSANDDILDDLCKMHEDAQRRGSIKGNWTQYSPSAFTQFMAERYELKWKRANALTAVNTALGYTSTRQHPNYKDIGYPTESGRHFHIELRKKGMKTKRTFIYIQKVETPILNNTEGRMS